MNHSLGKKIAELRRAQGITQDQLSEKLGVSPQAVSKWENDISYPDIMLLPQIAQIFSVSVDALFSLTKEQETVILPEDERKNLDELIFRIIVNSAEGDKVRVNLPMPLIKLAIQIGMQLPQVSGNDALKGIDFEQLFQLVENGVIGKILEVESADGDIVEIFVDE